MDHAHATLNNNAADLSNSDDDSEEQRVYWPRVLRAIWGAQDDAPFTLDGPFHFPLPEDAQGGAAVANAGAPSPAPPPPPLCRRPPLLPPMPSPPPSHRLSL